MLFLQNCVALFQKLDCSTIDFQYMILNFKLNSCLDQIVSITFDENNQIRVLSSDKYRETENLKSECIDFLKKIMQFNEMVTTLNEVLEQQA